MFVLISIVAILVLIADQITKIVTNGVFADAIPGVISFYSTRNTGAAFSIFGGGDAMIFFIILGVLFVIGFYVFNFMFNKNLKGKVYSVGFGLLIGGIMGNLIDRIAFAEVRDFIRLDFFPTFPIFNIADIALTIGVILVIIWLLFLLPKKRIPAEVSVSDVPHQTDLFEEKPKEKEDSVWDAKKE